MSEKEIDQESQEYYDTSEDGYFFRQFNNPYRSTVHFTAWLKEILGEGAGSEQSPIKICDMASGSGANIAYMEEHFPNASFVGVDIGESLVEKGNKRLAQLGKNRCKMVQGDWFDPDSSFFNAFDGIISYQTLLWFEEYSAPLKKLIELNPKWIALTSLFYEGDINYTIKLDDYTRLQENGECSVHHYNIYSIGLVKKLLAEYGYTDFHFKRFVIDVDIEQTVKNGLGTYTVKTESGERMQISGALMLPWYFIFAGKK